MTITPAALWGPTQVAGTATALYTCPIAVTAVIKRVTFLNTDTVAVTLTVHLVRSGGSATAANKLINALPLSANQTYQSPELANLVLTAGDAIQALASTASKINSTGSGFTL